MAYDKAKWHYGGEFPVDVPSKNAATHIGMFLAWIIDKDMLGDMHLEESFASIEKVKKRRMSGRTFLMHHCDETLSEDDLNERGNAFAKFYYETQEYHKDYETVFVDEKIPTIYHVKNTWHNFDRISPIIDRTYLEWKEKNTHPSKLKRPTARHGNEVIDTNTGTLYFDKPEGSIGPWLERPEFLANSLGKSCEIFIKNEPWCSWKLPMPIISGGKSLVVVASFQRECLQSVAISFYDPQRPQWSRDVELQLKKEHDAWLIEILGVKHDFPWGNVESGFDERSCSSSVYIDYRW